MRFWGIVSKRDPRKIGSGQFMPPGQTVVLLTRAADVRAGFAVRDRKPLFQKRVAA